MGRLKRRIAVLTIVGVAMAGCSAAAPTKGGVVSVKEASTDLHTEVTSVIATLEPYNPQIGDQGIPAEQVNFTVTLVPGDFECRVEVLHMDRIVGATMVTMGPTTSSSGSVAESVSVEHIRGGTFAGRPSDARVVCSK
jgi:hypothetical protein